jgi:hypothetical protein
VCTQTLAICFSVVGGLTEIAGLAMVVREIRSDGLRAREILDLRRDLRPPRVEPQSPELQPPIKDPTWKDVAEGTATRELEGRIAQVAGDVSELSARVERQKFELGIDVLREIDRGDNEMRQRFREILTGSMRERWIGVLALLIGILLSATGSVLSSLG